MTIDIKALEAAWEAHRILCGSVQSNIGREILIDDLARAMPSVRELIRSHAEKVGCVVVPIEWDDAFRCDKCDPCLIRRLNERLP